MGAMAVSWGAARKGTSFFLSFLVTQTRRLEIEEELRLHSEIIDHMIQGVHLTDCRTMKIVYAHPTIEKMFGYRPGELIGLPVSILNARTDKPPDRAG